MSALKELPVDSVLGNLPSALDVQRMRKVFQERIFRANQDSRQVFQIKDCQIERIKYKPRKTCLICYRLVIEDRVSGREHEQILCGRIYENGGSASRFIKAEKKEQVKTPIVEPLLHFPDLDMVLWAFPNERKLRWLPHLIDSDFLKEKILPQLMATRWGAEWKLTGLTHCIIHYKPEDACTVRVQAQLSNDSTGEVRSWVLYGKTFSEEQGEEIQHIMTKLWQASRWAQKDFKLARPLGFLPHYKMLWQEGLPGTPLFDQERTDPNFFRLLEQAAAALVQLHRIPMDCNRKIRVRDVVELLKEMKELIGTSFPSIRPTLSRVVDRLIRQADSIEEGFMATLHGDLHLKNILVDEGKIYLIDLDASAIGTPLLDLGSFSAGVITLAIMNGETWEMAEKKIRVFTERYRKEAPWDIPRQELDWHTTAALINERAFRSLKGLKAGRMELVKVLVDIADGLSQGLHPGSFIKHVELR
ncbi:MAG: phosphotransferase family protein [Nitrospinaceae bacterium]